MAKMYNAIGQTYGRLLVLKSLGVLNRKQIVLTRCSCGTELTVCLSNLRSGNTVSCGCFRKETLSIIKKTHGMRNTRLYRVYRSMLERCYNQNSRSYINYGQRGITVCSVWKASFDNFLTWAKQTGYTDSLEIDRIDVNLGYSPENCRWSSETVQARNRRTRKHSSSYTGVYQKTSSGKWLSAITVNKQRISLGAFNTEKEAWVARCNYITSHKLQDFQMNTSP